MKAYSEAVKGDVLEMNIRILQPGINIPEKRPVLLPASGQISHSFFPFSAPDGNR